MPVDGPEWPVDGPEWLEDGLLVVAALGDVEPIARRGETGFAGHEKDPSLNSGLSSPELRLIGFAPATPPGSP